MSSRARWSTTAPTLNFYCIDIDTVTYNGIGYAHGTLGRIERPRRRGTSHGSSASTTRRCPTAACWAHRQPAVPRRSRQPSGTSATVTCLQSADPLHDVVGDHREPRHRPRAPRSNHSRRPSTSTPAIDTWPGRRGPSGRSSSTPAVVDAQRSRTTGTADVRRHRRAPSRSPTARRSPQGTFVLVEIGQSRHGRAQGHRTFRRFPSGNVYLLRRTGPRAERGPEAHRVEAGDSAPRRSAPRPSSSHPAR